VSAITDVITDIASARRLREIALDELERLEGIADTRDAKHALNAAYTAERDAHREFAKTHATDLTDVIMKASVLIDATTGENLGEPLWENELPALRASFERDVATLGSCENAKPHSDDQQGEGRWPVSDRGHLEGWRHRPHRIWPDGSLRVATSSRRYATPRCSRPLTSANTAPTWPGLTTTISRSTRFTFSSSLKSSAGETNDAGRG
jgi:hypothetical protein